jgi:hypothetical protein
MAMPDAPQPLYQPQIARQLRLLPQPPEARLGLAPNRRRIVLRAPVPRLYNLDAGVT